MTKIYNNTYEEITDFKNMEYALKRALEGSKKYRKDAILFCMNKELNMVRLWRDLKKGTYEFGDYIEFKVYEPKERIIKAPKIRDKVAQFAVHNVIKDVYKNVFIKHSYACLEERGTHAAVTQVQKNLRIAGRIWKEPWIVKFDVSKFFYSIDKEILKKILRKKISCRKTLWLLDKIIDSTNDEKGIPLGNVTSQDFANIYLNELDQYVKRFCKVRYYVRYMDDAVAVVETREQAKILKEKMEKFIEKHLNLKANPKKTQIFPIKQGVNAYGYKI